MTTACEPPAVRTDSTPARSDHGDIVLEHMIEKLPCLKTRGKVDCLAAVVTLRILQ